MFNLIIGLAGLCVAASYIGFLSYKIEAIPLWIIVVGTFILALYDFIQEYRNRPRHGGRAGRAS